MIYYGNNNTRALIGYYKRLRFSCNDLALLAECPGHGQSVFNFIMNIHATISLKVTQWNKIFMEIFRSISQWFFASFPGVLDWIVFILVWFERSLHSAQVSGQSCPWPLKLMTSQRVERTWIRTGGYTRFRGEWVNSVWDFPVMTSLLVNRWCIVNYH